MNKSIRSKVSLIILVYILLTAAFSIYIYRIEYKNKEEQLNNSLYAAAKSLDMIIGPDFFDKYDFYNRISASEYEKITKVLNNFADSLGLEYVYAMVRQNNTIYFVVSNETEDDLIRGTPSIFYNPYPFPPNDLTDAFDEGKVTYRYYSAYRNIWNSYYSIFLPGISPGGNKYMLAADIKLQDQISILRSSIYKAIILIIIFMIPLIPLLYILKNGADRRARDLEKLIYTDKLTHLPNRDGFIRDTAPVEQECMSVIMIDIDSFRDINNLFGGIVGDRVLLRISDIINEICTPNFKLYKFPVDEFILLAKDCMELEFIIQITENIINTISDESFVNIGQPLDLTVTAGIVYQETMYMDLLSHANIAKNKAKHEKKGWILYDDSMKVETNYNNNFKTIGFIKEAIKADMVVPYYQPIKNNYTDEIEKYEALIGIQRENGEVLLPGGFLEVARKSKLYKELTLCMIRKSFRDFQGWEKPFH